MIGIRTLWSAALAGGLSVPLTGAAASPAAGSFAESFDYATTLTGAAAAPAAGSFTAFTGTIVVLTGAAAAPAAGSFAEQIDTSNTLTGAAASPAAGSFTVTEGAIALTELADASKNFQRAAGADAKTLTFSGTYTGQTPASVEIRLLRASDGVTVARDWAALAGATIAAGAWSGTSSVASTPNFVVWQARSKDASGNVIDTASHSTGQFGVGSNTLFIGQSLLSEMETVSSTPPTVDADTIRFNLTNHVWETPTGNGEIRFLNLMRPALGRTQGLIMTAQSGQGVTAWQPGQLAPATPVLSQVAGGALGARTYVVKTTYTNVKGETTGSAEATLAISANNLLKVTSPATPTGAHSGASGWNVYVDTVSGSETKQNGATPIALGTDFTEPTSGLVAGTTVPVSNTTTGGAWSNAMLGANSATGTHAGSDWEFAVWRDGEFDAGVASPTTPAADIKTGTLGVINALLSVTGRTAAQMRFGIMPLGNLGYTPGGGFPNASDAGTDAIRVAQAQLVTENPALSLLYLGSAFDLIRTGSTLVQAHITAPYYEVAARRFVQSLAFDQGAVAFGGGGPKITSATFAPNGARVTVVTDAVALLATDGTTGGTNLTKALWRVFVNGVQKTISAIAFQQPSRILIDLSATTFAATNTVVLDYCYGEGVSVDATDVFAYDNRPPQGDALFPGLPLRPSVGQVTASVPTSGQSSGLFVMGFP